MEPKIVVDCTWIPLPQTYDRVTNMDKDKSSSAISSSWRYTTQRAAQRWAHAWVGVAGGVV